MHSKLMSHRFDPPGGWRWKCRFSVEELEMMYCKLFNFNQFEARGNCLFQTIKTYDVRRNEFFGMVRLEDGGMKNLACCMIEELDWFLFVGASFCVADPRVSWRYMYENRTVNPLHGRLSREEALVTLDLLPEKFSSEPLADESVNCMNSRQLA